MYNLGCKVYFFFEAHACHKEEDRQVPLVDEIFRPLRYSAMTCDYANDGNTFHDAYGGVMHADR